VATHQEQKDRVPWILAYAQEGTWDLGKSGWLVAARVFLGYPLPEVGAGSFSAAQHEFCGQGWLNAHIVHLQVLGETGIVTGAAFLWSAVSLLGTRIVLRRRIRQAREGRLLGHNLCGASTLMVWGRLITGVAGHNLGTFTYCFAAGRAVSLDTLTPLGPVQAEPRERADAARGARS
jgi:hypothetical protein